MPSHGQHVENVIRVLGQTFISVHMGLRFVQQLILLLCGGQRTTMVQAYHAVLPQVQRMMVQTIPKFPWQ